jgi:hypothetical protein
MPNENQSERIAFDYAWNYFSLHAGQRMQSVNFFLIAAAFLVGAYVSATVVAHPGLAAGISIVGAFSSFVFYRIERRVRGLLHAAENALRPVEERLAAETGNKALRILKSVDQASPDAWKYSKVFRMLYLVVGLGFLAATLYSVGAQVALTPNTTDLFPRVLRLMSGVILLVFAFESLSGSAAPPVETQADPLTRLVRSTPLILGIAAGVAGIGVLFRLGFWGQ